MAAPRQTSANRSIRHIVELLSPSFRVPSGWLPLPQALAMSLPWKIDFFDDRPPLPVADLADPAAVARLSADEQAYCWMVLDYALRDVLRKDALPPQLLELPLDSACLSDAKVSDVLTLIGASPVRLLKSLAHAPTLHHFPTRMRLLRVPKAVLAQAEDAARAGKQFSRPFLRRRRRPNTAATEQVEWATKRLQFSADARVSDDHGEFVTAQDPRFGREVLSFAAARTRQNEALPQTLREQLANARQSTLADELVAIAAALVPHRSDKKRGRSPPAIIVGRTFGVGGHGDLRVRTIASEFGIQYQRISQIRLQFLSRAKEGTIYTPTLSWASEALSSLRCGTEAKIREALGERLGDMTVQGAVELVKVLGHVQPGWIAHPDSENLTNATLTNATLRIAAEATRQAGAFAVHLLAGYVGEEIGSPVSPKQVLDVLEAAGGTCWLDSPHRWGYISTEPLVSEVVEIFASAAPHLVHVTDIGVGIARASQARGNRSRFHPVPPEDTLTRMLQSRHEVYNAGQGFSLVAQIHPNQLLSGLSLLIFNAIRDAGNVITLKHLLERLASATGISYAQGTQRTKVHRVLLSPWVQRISYGVYAMRGVPNLVAPHSKKDRHPALTPAS